MAHHSFLCRNKVIGCSWLQRVTSRQHGRGHGTLVSRSTGVGCISKETEVKKLLLVGTTVLLMATSASAGPEAEHRGHWVAPGQWQMNDIGRNHGNIGGPGIPKCNPWVPRKWSRLYPGLFKRVPSPS